MKEIFGIIVSVFIFFGMLTFISVYDSTMREECRLAAIQQNYTATDIQAICK